MNGCLLLDEEVGAQTGGESWPRSPSVRAVMPDQLLCSSLEWVQLRKGSSHRGPGEQTASQDHILLC